MNPKRLPTLCLLLVLMVLSGCARDREATATPMPRGVVAKAPSTATARPAPDAPAPIAKAATPTVGATLPAAPSDATPPAVPTPGSGDEVAPPPDAERRLEAALGFDLQLPAEAEIDFQMQGMTSIRFEGRSLEEVNDFILKAMTGAGYEVVGQDLEFGLFNFQKDGTTILASTIENEGYTSLLIMDES